MTQTLADELLGLAHAGALATERLLPKTWTTVGCPISFTILGEPASKANSRSRAHPFVKDGEKPRVLFIKSAKARAYEKDALRQIPPAFRLRLEGPVFVKMTIWYASERSDLDESLILDILQDRWARGNWSRSARDLVQAGVYRNDKQVREKWIKHGIDRANPRAEITVQTLVAQQEPLF
jgi:Holliday junction resolvase RusA-like endonuclease